MAEMNLLVAGPGLIGGELLAQVAQVTVPGVALKVIGVANSKGHVVDVAGVTKEMLDDTQKFTTGSVVEFVERGAALKQKNTVFVDCTASDAVSPAYAAALERSIHVVTANKKVNSDDPDYRAKVRLLASKPGGPRFRYEANVGAGLPIIRPLQDFILTGDKVQKIEAILSGTLAYLFNTLAEGCKFSEVVRKAKSMGFTEPDPRDDLNGSDVARKIVILAREAGFQVGLDDVVIEPFLPDSCVKAPSVDAFFETLETDFDAKIEHRRAEAAAKGEQLRFLAVLDAANPAAPTMKLSLANVPATHPAASVTGSENICIFTTNRYNANPCVIKGPGAGAAVTAAGVFADILSLSDSSVVAGPVAP